MTYILAFLLCCALGFLAIRRLNLPNLSAPLTLLFSIALGLGMAGHLVFYTHVLLNWHNPYLPATIGLLLIFLLAPLPNPPHKKGEGIKSIKTNLWGLATLAILAVPLLMEANTYPFGGWDAWSSWNLKAKFIYLGKENWKDVHDPVLWRSNTHYPLLLPSITVWFWDLMGTASQTAPMINSIVFTLLTMGVLIFGLQALGRPLWQGAILALAMGTTPFILTLAVSQYSEIVFALYFISALVCILLGQNKDNKRILVLAAVFIGLLSFTKMEGTVASVILFGLLFQQVYRDKKMTKAVLFAFGIAALPTVLFQLFLSPPNAAFINGLFSAEKPSTLARLGTIALFPWMEFMSLKWSGLWILSVLAVSMMHKNAFSPAIRIIPTALALYLAVVFAYYQVNTFFEIGWWMSTTLSRIVFALLPSVMLWVGLSLKPRKGA